MLSEPGRSAGSLLPDDAGKERDRARWWGRRKRQGVCLPPWLEGAWPIFSQWTGGDPDQIMGARLAEAGAAGAGPPCGIKVGIDAHRSEFHLGTASCFRSCGRPGRRPHRPFCTAIFTPASAIPSGPRSAQPGCRLVAERRGPPKTPPPTLAQGWARASPRAPPCWISRPPPGLEVRRNSELARRPGSGPR